ncbi:MAG TPA: OmpA family protein [Longimicrobiales bacterium]|nr:OmpA family protein [Longimicrobiales bacterium]
MYLPTRAAAACVLTTLAFTACATKGQLRTAVEQERAAWNAAVEAERAERVSSDERLAADLADLRNDLQAMRTEFDADIAAVAHGLQFILPVHFGYDDTNVQGEAMDALTRFADIVSRHYTGSLVTVEGFADPAGSQSYNIALSTRRAEAVRDYLMEQGISAQLRVVGYGEDRLVIPDAKRNEPGAELNRRVVFVIETPAAAQPITMLDSEG